MTVVDEPATWHRPDPRGLIATGLGVAGTAVVAGVPTGIGIASGTSTAVALAWVVPIAVLVVGAAVAIDLVRCRRTLYRVADDRFEIRTSYVGRRSRTLPRERIRVVDLTADPLSRALDLVTVQIATGEQGSAPVRLWAVRSAVGRSLRDTLLVRSAAAPTRSDAGLLAAVRPGWLGYGVVSVLTPGLAAGAVGGAFTVAGWFDLTEPALAWIGDRLDARSGALGLLVVLLVGAVGALAVTAEAWWNHRLTRGPEGALRVRRGLLTTRSISVEERRLRGVELVEPLGARLFGGVRVDALVTGMAGDGDEGRSQDATLLPVVPRAVAVPVAAAVLHRPVSTALRPHPAAALLRRRVRAAATLVPVVVVLAAAGVLLWTPLLHAAWVVALLGTPVALLTARAAHRALGHALTDEHLLVRSGVLRRATAVLRRDAVLGWTLRSTPVQRRLGLVTLVATTATRSGGCLLRDVGAGDALALAYAVSGETLGPFVEARGGDVPTIPLAAG